MIKGNFLYAFRISQVLYAIFLVFLIIQDLLTESYDTNAFADLFINYRGGFVRRGLLGELFLYSYDIGLSPVTVALVLSFISFLIIAYYLVKQFVKHDYELSLLMICFLLGGFGVYGFGGFRRDFMMLCIFLFIIKLLRNCNNKWLAYGGANIIFCIAVLMYEPFVFWAFPLLFFFALLDFNYIKSFFVWSPALITFAICCLYSGGERAYQAIWHSVNGFIDNPGIIRFLCKSTNEAIAFHLSMNFGSYHHIPVIIISIVSIISLIYYFVNGFYVFSLNEETKECRKFLLLILCSVLFCQLPMFTVLSTDYSRTCITSTIGSLIFYFSLKTNELEKIFGFKTQRIAGRIISFVDSKMKPSRYKIVFILLFVGVTSWTGSNEGFLGTSEVGEILRVLLRGL